MGSKWENMIGGNVTDIFYVSDSEGKLQANYDLSYMLVENFAGAQEGYGILQISHKVCHFIL